jgi:NAD(P)-dependent dehydrogenase (short-subunit alcohol dehydrogenase family)
MNSASQVILITGCSCVFGRLTAESLARRGHTVFATMRDIRGKNAQSSRDIQALAEREKIKLHALEMDVANDASVEAGVKSLLAQARRLDVVINNAGVYALGHAETFTPDALRRVMEINVFGAHRVNRAALPTMRAQKSGLLVHMSSTLARYVLPCMAPYSASKAALEMLAESYRYELAGLGIDSVMVEPGGHPTDTFAKRVQPDDPQRAAGYGPVAEMPQQLGTAMMQLFSQADGPKPQEVADALVRLIDQPAGQRPLRTVVDRFMGAGAEAMNVTASQVATQILSGMGMQALVGGPARS